MSSSYRSQKKQPTTLSAAESASNVTFSLQDHQMYNSAKSKLKHDLQDIQDQFQELGFTSNIYFQI